jgi:PIN domain nuclease of toxin-antitoxin system
MLNLDTHILIYLLNGDLSDREHQLVVQEPLAISDIVLWELAKLVQLGRISIDLNSPAFLTCLQQMTIIPISLEIARVSIQLDFRSDPADELIAATSIVAGIPLLTRDHRIRISQLVPFA